MALLHSANKKSLVGLALTGLLSGVALCAISMSSYAAVVDSGSGDPPVDFEAANVEYDDVNQKVTAFGDVEIVQEDRIIKADRVVYDLKTEMVTAEGNVALLEKNGDVHFVEHAELEKGMQKGYIKKLQSILADGSRFTADEGHRVDANIIEMDNATYTPCEPCKLDSSKPPAWQIRADKVVHDNSDHTITYKDATFEVAGLPIAYVPYFSHGDGTVKQKSGFLTPEFNMSSDLGFSVTPRYYWAIDPTQDATFGVRTFIENAPMVTGEYRKRFENASLQFSGSTTYSDRTDSSGGADQHINDEWRGHLFGKGIWDIDDKYRAGFRAAVVSDDQYLRQYDISRTHFSNVNDTDTDVLENELYLERFDDRNYAVARTMAFQDIRTSDRAADQPNILPEVQASFLGDPGQTLGGRWSLDMSMLGLTRKGNGQDVIRGSTQAGWERKDILDIGVVNVISASIRADAYSVPTRDDNLIGSGDGSSTSGRFYPVINNVTSYPVVNNMGDVQAVIEPMVSITASTSVENDTDIPNEDSQDVQIDANNIFEANRFPGLDRVEDNSHVTYGIRTGLHDVDGSKAEVFLGQSYRLKEKDNPFPQGSGLDTQTSDYVGAVSAVYKDMFNLDYRFELSSDDLTSQRHELDAGATFDRLSLNTSYFYAQSLEGTDLTESREQLFGGLQYRFSDEWVGNAAARYDLGETEGLRSAGVTLEYLGQCYTIATTASRNFTYESTGDSATEITVRLGLKNIGEFGSSQ